MKPTVYISLWLLFSLLCDPAKAKSDNLFADLPSEEREEFYENARHYIQNTYYYQIAEAISNPACHKDLIGYLMAGDDACYKPELLPQTGNLRFLTPSQYLRRLCQHFSRAEGDELEFIVSKFSSNKQIHPDPDNPLTCFIQMEYNLEVRLRKETLLKRRCRMCCLFPQPLIKTYVKTMQVEPVEDIYADPARSATQENPPDETMRAKGTNTSTYVFILIGLAVVLGGAAVVLTRGGKARGWLAQAANEGRKRGEYILGCCCQHCQMVKDNETKAIRWYKKAARHGHAKAQYKIGLYHHNNSQFDIAAMYFTQAARQGNAQAQNQLGNYHKYGQGNMPKDERTAAKLFAKAAEQGYAAAQYNLGVCHFLGSGAPKDESKAVAWYTKAARKGNAQAQFNLGHCYKTGRGIAPDKKKAIHWYTKAARQGHTGAKSALKLLQQTNT